MASREEQKVQRRQEIIYHAVDLFVTKGYHGTKIADIAGAADMSVGLLFHYFESKEKLFEEILQLSFQGMEKEIKREGSPLETLEKVVNDVITSIHQDALIGKLFVLADQAHYLASADNNFQQFLVHEQIFIENSAKLLQEGQALGEIRSGNPQALAIVLWSAIQGYAQHHVQHPAMPIADPDWFLAIIKKES